MQYAVLLVLLAVIVVIIFVVRSKSAYYGKIFSDEHYTEIGDWLQEVLELGSVDESSLAKKTALHSSAGCALSFTRTIDDKDSIHIAISQIGQPSTNAVCNRLAFLIFQILKNNESSANLFYTESHVHHVILTRSADGEWLTNPVASAVADMKLYEPLPFQFQSMNAV